MLGSRSVAGAAESFRLRFSGRANDPLLAYRWVIGPGEAPPEPFPFQAFRQTLYSQDLKLVARAAPGAEAILRMSPQVCL
jgi:hypothetical protein